MFYKNQFTNAFSMCYIHEGNRTANSWPEKKMFKRRTEGLVEWLKRRAPA
jgi:hypothetical protein